MIYDDDLMRMPNKNYI